MSLVEEYSQLSYFFNFPFLFRKKVYKKIKCFAALQQQNSQYSHHPATNKVFIFLDIQEIETDRNCYLRSHFCWNYCSLPLCSVSRFDFFLYTFIVLSSVVVVLLLLVVVHHEMIPSYVLCFFLHSKRTPLFIRVYEDVDMWCGCRKSL